MSWNVDYVVLILFTTVVSYFSAIKINQLTNQMHRKIYLWLSIISSLGVLFFYKYFNFFGQSINQLLGLIQSNEKVPYLDLLLPVGISFYTFQTLSYSIDIYNRKLQPEKHFGIYALYVSFFPQLVAGPIERSTRLLPQFRMNQKLKTENIIEGAKWIIYGYFLKLVIADRLALFVNTVYNNSEHHTGGAFLIASVLFAFQIFGDFAGYSGIALGIAKILDIDLMVNFKRPYFAHSIGDFWHRWHISLSTWFRDYFYIPMGGSRVSVPHWYLNLYLTFLVSGLWHGANWTFVIWGGLHGIYIVLENLLKLAPAKKKLELWKRIFRASIVFVLADFAWIFFRANSIGDAFYIINQIFTNLSFEYINYKILFYGLIGIFIMLLVDIRLEVKENSELINNKLSIKSVSFFIGLVFITLFIGVFDGGQFIYFQF